MDHLLKKATLSYNEGGSWRKNYFKLYSNGSLYWYPDSAHTNKPLGRVRIDKDLKSSIYIGSVDSAPAGRPDTSKYGKYIICIPYKDNNLWISLGNDESTLASWQNDIENKIMFDGVEEDSECHIREHEVENHSNGNEVKVNDQSDQDNSVLYMNNAFL